MAIESTGVETHAEASAREHAMPHTAARWRLLVGMAQLLLASITLLCWLAGVSLVVVALGALATGGLTVVSLLIWRRR
jgi:hypothetical protein